MAATTAAFATVELLEQILSHLSFFDLLAARGVSSQWLDVILGSSVLRRNLFLESDCGDEGLVLNKGSLMESEAGDPADMFRIAPRYRKSLSGGHVEILPVLKSRVMGELGGRRNLWEDVYLTTPPCAAVVIGVVVGKREVWATVFGEGGVTMGTVAMGFEKILGSPIEMDSGGEVKLEFGFWVEEV
ncbi:hypothetical protein LTR27_002594 [Elasticomyces elasticus]|nr:hypothetical protein LTR27_002594 [Elasticomyces elasticus]